MCFQGILIFHTLYYWLALLPALACASCHQTSNQTSMLNQIRCKKRKRETKRGGEGELQCATINYSPPQLQMCGVTFHYMASGSCVLHFENTDPFSIAPFMSRIKFETSWRCVATHQTASLCCFPNRVCSLRKQSEARVKLLFRCSFR